MSDDVLAAKIERGKRAELLLRDPLLTEAFARFEADCMSYWMTTKVNDVEARERIWQAVNVAGKVQSMLVNMAANGRIAKDDLERLIAGQ
jgi:hypothetical protein